MADSSSERSVKVTYSGRKRRRKSVINYAENSEEEGAPQDNDKGDGSDYNEAPEKGEEDKRHPKKVDVHLPGPSPKPSKPNSSEKPTRTKPVSSAKRAPRSRAVSAVPNAEAEGDVISPPPTTPKPLSAVGSKAIKYKVSRETPDSVADDRSSIGESSKATPRIRKTEAERMEFLQEDPHSGEVEPHRIFCTSCKEWVDLNPKRRYIMRLWIVHRKQCGKQGGNNERDDASVATKEMEVDDDDDRTSVAPSEPAGRKDKQKGSFATPSSRVALAQRKLQLVNDAQVKGFTAHTAECTLCSNVISLASSVEYDLTEWEKHKETCTRASLIISSPKPASAPVKMQPPAPPPEPAAEPMLVDEPTSSSSSARPPSTTSTEATVIGTEASPPRGEKRKRDEDVDEGKAKEQERSVRPRTSLYVPENDTLLGWMMLPFHSLVRGFRDGWGGSSR